MPAQRSEDVHQGVPAAWGFILAGGHPFFNCYFFCSIGAPQHLSAPVPPLVTITWEPHFPQMYTLPSWLAMRTIKSSCRL